MNGFTKGSLRHAAGHPLAAKIKAAPAAQAQPPPEPPPKELSQFQSLKLEVAMMVYAAIYARNSFTEKPSAVAWNAADNFVEEMQRRQSSDPDKP
jgi:hypothetical protein